jgi:hypothetical protein
MYLQHKQLIGMIRSTGKTDASCGQGFALRSGGVQLARDSRPGVRRMIAGGGRRRRPHSPFFGSIIQSIPPCLLKTHRSMARVHKAPALILQFRLNQYTTGFLAGVLDPSYVVTAGSAMTTAALIFDDALIRGVIWRRNALIGLGVTTLSEVRNILLVYGQSTTFIVSAFAIGFTFGYLAGSTVRAELLDQLGITNPSNGV